MLLVTILYQVYGNMTAVARHVAKAVHVARSHISLVLLSFVVGKSVVEELILLKKTISQSQKLSSLLILKYLSCAKLSEIKAAEHNRT
jgi:hypothetical protein